MRDSRAEGDRWLRQAESDLAFARVALRERFFAQARFLAQQVAEKAVKAVAFSERFVEVSWGELARPA
jgi:HEPN domain-containing protein